MIRFSSVLGFFSVLWTGPANTSCVNKASTAFNMVLVNFVMESLGGAIPLVKVCCRFQWSFIWGFTKVHACSSLHRDRDHANQILPCHYCDAVSMISDQITCTSLWSHCIWQWLHPACGEKTFLSWGHCPCTLLPSSPCCTKACAPCWPRFHLRAYSWGWGILGQKESCWGPCKICV